MRIQMREESREWESIFHGMTKETWECLTREGGVIEINTIFSLYNLIVSIGKINCMPVALFSLFHSVRKLSVTPWEKRTKMKEIAELPSFPIGPGKTRILQPDVRPFLHIFFLLGGPSLSWAEQQGMGDEQSALGEHSREGSNRSPWRAASMCSTRWCREGAQGSSCMFAIWVKSMCDDPWINLSPFLGEAKTGACLLFTRVRV